MKITYEFEELPLLVDGTAVAGLLDGQAEIHGAPWDWSVDEIYLTAYGDRTKQRILVERSSALWPMIVNSLEDFRSKSIEREFERADRDEREARAQDRRHEPAWW